MMHHWRACGCSMYRGVISGPLTAMLLADMGADVIKVENPAAPDFTRATGNSRGGMTAFYYNLNRGKRSLAVRWPATARPGNLAGVSRSI